MRLSVMLRIIISFRFLSAKTLLALVIRVKNISFQSLATPYNQRMEHESSAMIAHAPAIMAQTGIIHLLVPLQSNVCF